MATKPSLSSLLHVLLDFDTIIRPGLLSSLSKLKKKKKNEEKLADEDGADQNYFMMLLT